MDLRGPKAWMYLWLAMMCVTTDLFAGHDEALPLRQWVRQMDAPDPLHNNLWRIRDALGMEDSAHIFQTLDRLEQMDRRAGYRFQVRIRWLRAYKFYDLYGSRRTAPVDSMLKSALYIAYQNHDDFLAAEVSRVLGHLALDRGEQALGLTYTVNAADLQDRVGLDQFRTVHVSRRRLGEYFYHNGEYGEALRYLPAAAEYSLADGMARYAVNLLNTEALCWWQLSKPDSAFRRLGRAKALARELQDTLWMAILAGTEARLLLDKSGDRNIDSLLRFYKDYCEGAGEWSNVANARRMRAALLSGRGLHREALQELGLAQRLLDRMPQPTFQAEVYEQYAAAHRGMRQADSVHFYLNRAAQLRDSISSMQAFSRLDLARIRAQQERFMLEYARLEQQRESERNRRNLVLYTTILLASLLALGLNRQRLLQRLKAERLLQSNRELEHRMQTAKRQVAQFRQSALEKSELVERLRNELAKPNHEHREAEIWQQLAQFTLLTEEEWNEFRLQFESLHPGFFARLRQMAPDMTEAEQRLAALLKLGLGNNQIAGMLGISADSVRRSKHRLRNRLGIDSGTELISRLEAL